MSKEEVLVIGVVAGLVVGGVLVLIASIVDKGRVDEFGG